WCQRVAAALPRPRQRIRVPDFVWLSAVPAHTVFSIMSVAAVRSASATSAAVAGGNHSPAGEQASSPPDTPGLPGTTAPAAGLPSSHAPNTVYCMGCSSPSGAGGRHTSWSMRWCAGLAVLARRSPVAAGIASYDLVREWRRGGEHPHDSAGFDGPVVG